MIFSFFLNKKLLCRNLQTIAMNSIDGKGGFAVKGMHSFPTKKWTFYWLLDVPGLWLFPNFITEEEEEMLMKQIDEKQWHSMQVRWKKKHWKKWFLFLLLVSWCATLWFCVWLQFQLCWFKQTINGRKTIFFWYLNGIFCIVVFCKKKIDFTLNRVEEQIPKLVPFKCDQLTINR